jgi:hypothetical protein
MPINATETTIHKNRLGQEKAKERLLKLYEAMEPQLGVSRTARSVNVHDPCTQAISIPGGGGETI